MDRAGVGRNLAYIGRDITRKMNHICLFFGELALQGLSAGGRANPQPLPGGGHTEKRKGRHGGARATRLRAPIFRGTTSAVSSRGTRRRISDDAESHAAVPESGCPREPPTGRIPRNRRRAELQDPARQRHARELSAAALRRARDSLPPDRRAGEASSASRTEDRDGVQGAMPFSANSFRAASVFFRCPRPMPRRTWSALVNWIFS